MNTILALLTCIAMLFSGGAALPAQPETAEVLTIDNITVWNDSEVVTLNPSVSLTAQLGSEAGDFHFEIKDADGETRLPVSASLDADGITLDLGGENAYHISDEYIATLMDGSESEAALELLKSAAELLALSQDEEAAAEVGNQILAVFTEHYADKFTETQVEVSGQTLDGVEGDIDVFSSDMFALFDKLAEMDNAYGRYVKALFGIINSAYGTSYESFSQVYAEEIDDIENAESALMHVVFAGDDNLAYLSANFSYTDDDGDEAVDCNYTVTATGDSAEFTMEMSMNEDDTTSDCTLSLSLTDTVESFSMESNSNKVYSWEGADDDDQPTTYSYTSDASVIAGYSKVIVDEDTSTEEFTVTMDSVGNAGQDDETTQHYDLRGERNVSPEDGGSLAEQTFSVTVNDETYGLSYNAHRSEAEVQDFISDKTIVELYSDDEDESEDEGDDATESADDMMISDLSAMSEDLVALSSDESVATVLSMINSETIVDGDDDTYDDDDDYDDTYDYEDSLTRVSTLEEAAAIYTGTMPAYTAPEGYSIDAIDVDETTIYIQYTADDMPAFQLATYSYDAGMEVYTYKDGTLTALDGQVVQISPYYDGTVFSANVMDAQGNVLYFYFFDNATMDDATAVLSGIE